MLVLIVGPSGAGKDTLLNAVRANGLNDDPRFRFVRRVITRPADPKGENHEPTDEAAFIVRRDAGGFALTWRAHGLFYGVPADITADLDAGRVVVANVSRTVIADAAARFPTRLIEVTAPADVLARRLAARGREDAVEVAGRLSRVAAAGLPDDRVTIVNDGTVEQGARRLNAALIRAAQTVAQS